MKFQPQGFSNISDIQTFLGLKSLHWLVDRSVVAQTDKSDVLIFTKISSASFCLKTKIFFVQLVDVSGEWFLVRKESSKPYVFCFQKDNGNVMHIDMSLS